MSVSSIPNILKDSIQDSFLKLSWNKEGKEILATEKPLTIVDKLKLKYLITIGTPEAYRGQLWLACSKAKEYKQNNPTYYKSLIKLTTCLVSQSEKQIDLDLQRSNRKNDKPFIDKIKSILLCYSIRNTSIGYCQGFNFIVECLLGVVNDEEDVFWLFCMLIEDILPINFYSELAGVIIDTTLVETFLQNYFPTLSEFFKRNDLGVKNFVHKWLVTLFTENFLNETTWFIWDYLFLEGNIVLIKSCLAVFCILKNYLMQYDNNMEELFFALINQTKEIKKSNHTLIHALSLKQFEFNDDYVEQVRFTLSESIIDNINNDNSEKFNKKLEMMDKGQGENKKVCNVNWPFCVFESIITSPCVMNYFVLNYKKSPDYHSNYFFQTVFVSASTSPSPSTLTLTSLASLKSKEDIEEIKSQANDNEEDNDLLIERRTHVCHYKEEQTANESTEANSPNDTKNITKEFMLYRRMTKDLNYQIVRNKVMKGFKPKPYLDDQMVKSH